MSHHNLTIFGCFAAGSFLIKKVRLFLMTLKKKITKLIPWLLFLVLAFTYTFILAKPIDLTITDIGRHLVNGREIINQHWQVVFTNTYSYTMPDQNFINHHWLTGVIFWLIFSVGDFFYLHLFHTVILLSFLGCFFYLLRSKSSTSVGFFVSLLALVFLATRTEIRPESFGYLLSSIYLIIINHIQKTKKISFKTITGVFLLQLIWVNLHISFVFGLFVFGLFGLLELGSQHTLKKENKRNLIILLIVMVLTALFNPNTVQGALTPFTIFQDYGYKVFENQNLWFLRSFYPGPIIPLFYLTAITTIVFLLVFSKAPLFDKALAVTGIFLGWTALRNMPIFVIFAFPFLAIALQELIKNLKNNLTFEEPKFAQFLFLIIPLTMLWLTLASHPFFKKSNKAFELGLINGQQKTIEFLQKLPEGSRIFNNYDVGSALVFSLYPKQKVFVDNRPEAYSSSFFQNLYIPAQSSETIWEKAVLTYQFDFIVFGHRDITPWAQIFIKNRLRDSNWKMIYIDDFIFIFAKDTPDNKALIDQYSVEVPLSRLKI